MSTENTSHPIPKVAKTALALLNSQHQQNIKELAQQTLDAMGLDQGLDWKVDFDAGVVTQEKVK
jgi:long-subunit fatty acid transport protein